MTVCAVCLTHEGVALGTDSSGVWSDKETREVLYFSDNEQKLFEIGPRGSATLAACTWGLGGFKSKSIRHVLADLSDQVTGHPRMTFEDVSEALTELITPLYDETTEEDLQEGKLGLALGGHVPCDRTPKLEIIEYEHAGNGPRISRAEPGLEALFTYDKFFHRLVAGYDPELANRLKIRYSIADEEWKDLTKELEMQHPVDLPIREAAIRVRLFLDATIQMCKMVDYSLTMSSGAIQVVMVPLDGTVTWL